MNKILVRGLLFAATLGLLSGCQEPTPGPEEQPPTPIVDTVHAQEPTTEFSEALEWQMCPEQRPEMCAQIYQPVCGIVDTGVRCVTTPCPSSTQKTFGNACTACTDLRVNQYHAGECQTDNNAHNNEIDEDTLEQ